MEIKTLFKYMTGMVGDRHNPTDYHFTTEQLGQEYKDTIDKHCWIQKKTLIVCQSIDDYKQNTKAEIKCKALAKLAPVLEALKDMHVLEFEEAMREFEDYGLY